MPAVGQLQLATGSTTTRCTGTLIAPGVVLTAGHCLNGLPAQNAGQFVIPTAAPVGNAPSGPQFSIQSWKRLTGAAPDAHDVACVFLTTPVPKPVVTSYPRVYTGGVKSAFDKATLKHPGFIAGFGSFVTSFKQSSTTADGNRRWGAAPSDLAIYFDECGDINEGHCFNHWVWDSERNKNPQPEKGDSGGPLLMTDSTGPVVVAVYSGFWLDGFPHDGSSHSVWAATGDPGGTNNGAWIIDNCLGADADGDGVPDAIDNCPAVRCAKDTTLDPEDCFNPDQLDSDGDGVGETCDNCPKLVCDSMAAAGGVPAHVNCYNPGQGNLDGDSRGDACDLCPNTGAGSPGLLTTVEADTDHDGVGDACDFCDAPDPYAPCANSAFCFKSVCLIEPGAGLGYCASPTDSDGDGVADACDECPGLQSPDRSNSNLVAEEREKTLNPTVKHLADVCDPVPIVRLEAQKALVQIPIGSEGGYTLGDGQGPDDVAEISQTGWLGVDLASPTSKTVQRAVTYRHCSCLQDGTPVPFEKCTAPGGPCPSANPIGNQAWKVVTLTDMTGALYADANGVTTPKAFTTSQASPEVPAKVRWSWRADVLAGKVEGLGTCPGSSVLDCGTHGVIVTRTNKAPPYASTREQNHMLGDVFAMLHTPAVTPVLPKPDLGCPCSPKHWAYPDYLRDPDPFGFTGLFAKPTPLLIDPTGAVVAATTPASGIDVTQYFDAASLALLQTDGLWLGSVEPMATARYSTSEAVRSGIRAVSIERDFTGRAPIGVAMTGAGVTLSSRTTDDGISVAFTTTAGPPMLLGVSGAFSAVEGTVYMVGGRLPGGAAAGSVWEWSLDQRRWRAVPLAPPVPSTNVLSVGYTPDGQHLYVLDVDDHDSIGPKLKFARLFRMDLASGTSTKLLRVPYLGPENRFAAIAVMPDGLLALVSSTNKTHTVWRLDGRGQTAQFKGVFTAKGSARSGPVMGEDRLYLGVESSSGQLEVVGLEGERFHGGPPCTGL
ncbi:MAG: trypsin-like serine protease [Myxococcales bacterium]|nr:trypsin-like serine protease [Myxococcales bacterium]